MANKLKLNASFERAAKRLVTRKVLGPQVKHSFTEMRELVWSVFANEVLPEFGIRIMDYGKPETGADGKPKVDAKGQPVPNEVTVQIQQAKQAFKQAFDEGYTLESSNCGKHLSDWGFARSTVEETRLADEVFV